MQNKQQTYQRITNKEREEISRGLAQGLSVTDIATILNRPVSTISREVARNGGRGIYRACTAERKAQKSFSERKQGKRILKSNTVLQTYVHQCLQKKWSPEQIVIALKEAYPNDMTMRISHEAIYQYIYVLPRGSLKKSLITGLRQERKYRRSKTKKSNKKETRGKIADMLSIEERPVDVADRTIPGHWEGDLILGKYKQTALGTLVERTTRKVILVSLGKNKDATSVRRAFARELRKLPKEMTKSLTYDQGKEMSEHKQFTIDTGIQVYFAHPASPWERGTNENTNGLLRQYFPKGTDFSEISRYTIKKTERELNDRPRKALNGRKPDEVFAELLR